MRPFTGLKLTYNGVFDVSQKQEVYENFVSKNMAKIAFICPVDFEENNFIVFFQSPFEAACKLRYAFAEKSLKLELFIDKFAERLMSNILVVKNKYSARNLNIIRFEAEKNRGRFFDYTETGDQIFIFDSFIEAGIAHFYLRKRFNIYFLEKFLYFKIQQKKMEMDTNRMQFDNAERVFLHERYIEGHSEGDTADFEPPKPLVDPMEPVKVSFSESFDYSLSMFPDIPRTPLPRLPNEEPNMKDVYLQRKISRKVRANTLKLLANDL